MVLEMSDCFRVIKKGGGGGGGGGEERLENERQLGNQQQQKWSMKKLGGLGWVVFAEVFNYNDRACILPEVLCYNLYYHLHGVTPPTPQEWLLHRVVFHQQRFYH